MKKTNSQGFTLIELLVVIAIIGLLASVVLVSVGSARAKASNAAIKINLKKIVAIVGSDILENGSSLLTCTSPSTNKDLANACSAITKSGGTVSMFISSGSVAASASLAGASAGTWCVDSTGTDGAGTALATGVCQVSGVGGY